MLSTTSIEAIPDRIAATHAGLICFSGGVRSPYLGVQIAGIMLIGFAFACSVAFGILNALDNPNRNRWWLRWAIAALCARLRPLSYGWDWMCHPLAFWGLR